MKMTNMAIINSINTLDGLMSKKLPQKISYAIVKNMTILNGEYSCYTKTLGNLIEKYNEHAKKDENGEVIFEKSGLPVIEDAYKGQFHNEVADLLNVEVDVNMFTVPFAAFDYDEANGYDVLTASELFKIQSLICED